MLVGICTHLGCIPKGQSHGRRQGRLRRLVLPLPRLALRHGGPHPHRARRRATSRCRPTSSCPTPRSRSAEGARTWPATNRPIRPTQPLRQVAGRAAAAAAHDARRSSSTSRRRATSTTCGPPAACSRFFLGVQIVTGIVLAMHYVPSAADAFNSVEHIRRDVNYGWLIRNIHAVGASFFFLAVYIHIAPRPLLRLLQGAARGAVDPRRRHLPADDGHRLHGLLAALGADELLGRDRHHQPVLLHRRHHSRASARASCSGCGAATRYRAPRSTASTRCTTCCRS